MEPNLLNKVLPLLELAKFIGRATTAVISGSRDYRESFDHTGNNPSQEYLQALKPMYQSTLKADTYIHIISNGTALKTNDTEQSGTDTTFFQGYVGCHLTSQKARSLGVLSLTFDAEVSLTNEQERALKTVVAQMITILEKEEGQLLTELQKQLEVQREINRNIIENSKLSLWSCSLTEGTLEFDVKWANQMGYDQEELRPLGLRKWEAMIHPEDLEVLQQYWTDYIKGKTTNYVVQYRVMHKNGSWKWFLVSSNRLVRNAEGYTTEMMGTIEDITQQKSDYHKLEEALQRLTYLSRATSDAIWDLDLVNETLQWNDNFFESYGHQPDEYAKAGLALWIENIHPEDRARVAKSFDLSLQGESDNWEEEYRFRKANGEFLIVNDKAFIIRDSSRKAIRMVGALCDITERNNYVLKAKIANERFQRIADLTKEVIYDWDIINEDVYWGLGYVKYFGHKLPVKKVTLQTRINHIHPEDVQRVLELLKDLLKNAEQNYFEVKYRFLKGDGTYIDIHEKASILRNENGGPFRMVGSMRDVSEANRYLEQLQDSEKRYNDLFHLSPQPSWVYDLETLRFLDVNSAALDCYGYSRKEFVKLALADLRPAGEITPLMQEIEDVRSDSDKIYNGVFKHCKSNGEEFDVRIHSSPIMMKGRTCRQVVAFDISELTGHIKTIESQNAQFNKIAWMQSHVLRAPLVRMMGLANLLLDQEESNGKDHDFLLREIVNASNEIDQITRDIAQITNELKIKQILNGQ